MSAAKIAERSARACVLAADLEGAAKEARRTAPRAPEERLEANALTADLADEPRRTDAREDATAPGDEGRGREGEGGRGGSASRREGRISDPTLERNDASRRAPAPRVRADATRERVAAARSRATDPRPARSRIDPRPRPRGRAANEGARARRPRRPRSRSRRHRIEEYRARAERHTGAARRVAPGGRPRARGIANAPTAGEVIMRALMVRGVESVVPRGRVQECAARRRAARGEQRGCWLGVDIARAFPDRRNRARGLFRHPSRRAIRRTPRASAVSPPGIKNLPFGAYYSIRSIGGPLSKPDDVADRNGRLISERPSVSVKHFALSRSAFRPLK